MTSFSHYSFLNHRAIRLRITSPRRPEEFSHSLGHALPYHWGIGMVRCTPESGPATTRQCETGALRRSVKDK